MSIPTYEQVMLPLLQAIDDGAEWQISDLVAKISKRFNLSPEECAARLPSGQRVVPNRVHWAKAYLKKANLLDQPRRAVVRITDEGRAVLAQNLTELNTNWLKQHYPSIVEFVTPNQSSLARERKAPYAVPESSTPEATAATPEEVIKQAHGVMMYALAEELLENVKRCSPSFFERIVVELLVAMGYGGTLEDAGRAMGCSGDGGIDGIIKEDKLGLDVVCVQAKRWNSNVVGRPEIQAFVGSMEVHRTKKGVFVTTSRFSPDAIDYVKHTERKIVLIDGTTLASLMIEHNVGVSPYQTYELKKIDADYFDDSM